MVAGKAPAGAKKMGRPRIEIDKQLFENLCGLQCTMDEIALCFGCCIDTVEKWCKREYGKTFSVVFEEKKARGKVSLRRTQWKLAKKSAALAIFLGKNYLGQTDKQDVELSGKVGIETIAGLMMEDETGEAANGADTDA